MDQTDLQLLRELQQDATASYAHLGRAVGLSAAAAHERVRKLREHGVIRSTTIEVDPPAVGRDVLAFVTLSAGSWVGDAATRDALAEIPEVEAAYVVAGDASLLVKVRATTNAALQQVLRRLHAVAGITGTRTTVALETFFERPMGLPDGADAT